MNSVRAALRYLAGVLFLTAIVLVVAPTCVISMMLILYSVQAEKLDGFFDKLALIPLGTVVGYWAELHIGAALFILVVLMRPAWHLLQEAKRENGGNTFWPAFYCLVSAF